MPYSWSKLRDEWLSSTAIGEEDAKWAIEALTNSEEELFEIERKVKNNENAIDQVKNLKKKVRKLSHQKK